MDLEAKNIYDVKRVKIDTIQQPKLIKQGKLIIKKIETDEEGKIHLFYEEEIKGRWLDE